MMKTIYLSAVNIKDGGPRTILNSILVILLDILPKDCEIHIITNSFVEKSDEIFFKDSRVHLHIFNWPLRGLASRLIFEYIFLPYYMLGRRASIWFSLNDVSSFIRAKKRYVYFHNPSPFIPSRLFGFFPVSFLAHGLLYNLIYFINSRNYDNVFVQQQWMANVVSYRYKLNNVKVAKPTIPHRANGIDRKVEAKNSRITRFIYPALPRFAKNHSVIIDAVQRINKLTTREFEVIFTLDGLENEYSKNIFSRCKSINEIKFVGVLDKSNMSSLYENSDVLIFPSLLETWGLPISEAMEMGLILFLSDLPYAHEVASGYSRSYFFKPTDSTQLADLMINYLNFKLGDASEGVIVNADFSNLNELVHYILKSAE